MRKSSILAALFPAVRQEILAATLLSPEKSWYLSELAAHLKTSPSSLQRELEALAKSGLLQRKQEGRRTYYKAETASPVFGELRTLFSKTAGIIPLLKAEIDLLPSLRRVEEQFGREVNVTRYSEAEFRAKRYSRDRFLSSELKSTLITIVGSPNEFEKTTGRRQSPRTQGE